jgi:hypothetical protein
MSNVPSASAMSSWNTSTLALGEQCKGTSNTFVGVHDTVNSHSHSRHNDASFWHAGCAILNNQLILSIARIQEMDSLKDEKASIRLRNQ